MTPAIKRLPEHVKRVVIEAQLKSQQAGLLPKASAKEANPIQNEWGSRSADRWAELHARSRLPVKDANAERAWLGRLADGMEAGCACKSHWVAYLKEHPPTLDDYEAWAIEAHNAVNRRLNKPTLTVEQSRTAQGYHVYSDATGLGDAICGLYAVCGFADATGLPITYHAHSSGWLLSAGAVHPNLRIVAIEKGRIGVDLLGGSQGYFDQIAYAVTRSQSYCDHIAQGYGLPRFTPRRPASLS